MIRNREKKSNSKSNEAKKEAAEALTRFICFGLYGFGCGTDPKKIADWRNEKSWEERCQSFLQREGD